MRNLIIFSSVLLAACGGVNEDNFADKYIDAYCESGCSEVSCEESDDTTDTTGTGTVEFECDFDKAKAKECVDVDNWTCDDAGYPDDPAACDTVFSNCTEV